MGDALDLPLLVYIAGPYSFPALLAAVNGQLGEGWDR
jgi:hypothetical protein